MRISETNANIKGKYYSNSTNFYTNIIYNY